jgi:type IV pilus assembly protein PilA
MAILAAAIAPALIRYIDKSRRSDDVAAAESVNTAAQAAFSNEEAYDQVQDAMTTANLTLQTKDASAANVYLLASSTHDTNVWTKSSNVSTDLSTFISELSNNVGVKSPKLKYTKDGADGWAVGIDKDNNKPVVFITFTGTPSGVTAQEGKVNNSKYLEIQPSICAPYK